jgi:predicted nucleic acid-binding protein
MTAFRDFLRAKMHLLVDTDVVIWHLRNRSEIVALVKSLSQAGQLGISALTRLEVEIGAALPHVGGKLYFESR